MSWVSDAQTKIFSTVKGEVISSLLKAYPNYGGSTQSERVKFWTENITQDNGKLKDTSLPSIYIAFVSANERGQDLLGQTINAIELTAEVHIKTQKGGMIANRTTGFTDNTDIAWTVLEAFKKYGFTSTMPNTPTSDIGGVYETVSRFSRVIGQGDVI